MMSQNFNLELSDSTFAAIQRQVQAAGISPTDLVAKLLKKQYCLSTFSEEEQQKAQKRFENHLGEIDLGYLTGADNESIDEDLAKAYADTHEMI